MCDHAGKLLHDDVADLIADLIHREFAVGPHNLPQEDRWVGDLDRVGAIGAQTGWPELWIAQHDRVLGAPFQVAEPRCVDVVNL